MNLADFFEIIVCMLAVYGVYSILCRFLSRGCYKGDLSVGLHVKLKSEEHSHATLADGIRRAHFLTEGQRGKMLPPVILLNFPCDTEIGDELAELCEECEIYYKLM